MNIFSCISLYQFIYLSSGDVIVCPVRRNKNIQLLQTNGELYKKRADSRKQVSEGEGSLKYVPAIEWLCGNAGKG
jgi:hypothetical protein